MLQEPQLSAHGLGVGFDEGFVTASLRNFVEEDQRFDGLALEGIILELEVVRQAMVGAEPIVEQGFAGRCRAFVVCVSPFLNGLADGRDTGGSFVGDLQQGQLLGVRFFCARHKILRKYTIQP